MAISKDCNKGTVIYPLDPSGKGGKQKQIKFDKTNPENNYIVEAERLADEGQLFTYDQGRGGSVYQNKDKTSGYRISAKDKSGNYSEEHWGKENYKCVVSTNPDGGLTKVFPNGVTLVQNKDGASGYLRFPKDKDGNQTERHWGETDKDYYTKLCRSDGSFDIKPIPRNYDNLLEVHSSLNSDDGRKFVAMAKAELDKLRRPLVESMIASADKIVLTNTIIEYDPNIAKRGSAANPGTTIADVEGVSPETNKVIVARFSTPLVSVTRTDASGQQFIEMQRVPIESQRIGTVLTHEIGHMISRAGENGWLSVSQSFSEAYKADLDKVPVEMRQRIPQLIAGMLVPESNKAVCQDELFAEIQAASTENNPSVACSPKEIRENFPHSYVAAAALIKEYGIARTLGSAHELACKYIPAPKTTLSAPKTLNN